MEQHKIPRKPVPISPVSPPPQFVESPTTLSATTENRSYDTSLFAEYAEYAEPAESSRARHHTTSVEDQREAVPQPPLRSTQSSPNLHIERTQSSTASQKAGKAVVTAFEEARHFAGGLVSHPFESTKHYSILRHSHGLVFYTGSYTNIAITIFADRELPPDRSFWLQRRGWSGKTGLRAGVLFGTHGAWIDVTPSEIATADQVKPADERAWQRDISKFLRKAPRKLAEHVPRETAVLRVPCDAEDGYLRVVMCAGENGKKHLCPSPIFRLASTSLESSSLRGASLKTLPLEAAVKVGTAVGTAMVNTVAAPYIQTAKTFVSTQATSLYQPSALQTLAVQQAYDSSNVTDRLERLEQEYDARSGPFVPLQGQHNSDISGQHMAIGDDDGPVAPFPIRFHGKVVPGVGYSTERLGFPTANLSNVDSTITWKHSGVYTGYASIGLSKKQSQETSLSDEWHQAIVYITPEPGAQVNVVQKKRVRVHVLNDFHGINFSDAKLSVMLMGLIRPGPPQHLTLQETPEASKTRFYQDILVTQASLSRPAWAADTTLDRMRTASSGRSVTDRYVDMRQGVQDSVDKVPIHRLGIRTDSHGRRDQYVGNGGVSIPRSWPSR